ncbi:hypothetical protein PVAND_010433 [Polypedilum vanderplanki]|uniref:Uncharacterized protein n=1 Tax=Polypedilum vanderplanki TaxID=319348 RepID=A0A9J6CH89_POLVA|nr:hypothetical protein PVAND_010433 [Polypedilum vanderplanki]
MKKVLKISFFLFFMIESQSSSTTLQCDFKTDSNEILYSCFVQNNQILKMNIDEIEGDHIESKSDNDVKGFLITSNVNITAFPRVGGFFKNLKLINITQTNLNQTTKRDLKDYKELKSLYLDKNQIQVIEPELFIFNPKLENLSLMDNKITYIDPFVFKNLKSLKILRLAGKKCVSNLTSETEISEVVDKINNLLCYSRKSLKGHYEIIINNIDNIEKIGDDNKEMVMRCVEELYNMNTTLHKCSADLFNCTKNSNEQKTENKKENNHLLEIDQLKNEIKRLILENHNLRNEISSNFTIFESFNDTTPYFIEWNELKITRIQFTIGLTLFISISFTVMILILKIRKPKNEDNYKNIVQKCSWQCSVISPPIQIGGQNHNEPIYDEPCSDFY